MSGNPHYIPNPTEYYRTWEEEPYYLPQEYRHAIKGAAGQFSRAAHTIPFLAPALSVGLPAAFALGTAHQVHRSVIHQAAEQKKAKRQYKAERAAEEQAEVDRLANQAEQHLELIDKLDETKQEMARRGDIWSEIQHEQMSRLIDQNRQGIEQTVDRLNKFVDAGEASLGLISNISKAHKKGLAAQVAQLKGIQQRLSSASFALGPPKSPKIGPLRPKYVSQPIRKRIASEPANAPQDEPPATVVEPAIEHIFDPPIELTLPPPLPAVPARPVSEPADNFEETPEDTIAYEQMKPPIYDFEVPNRILKSPSINTQKRANDEENRQAREIWNSIESFGLPATMESPLWHLYPVVAHKFTPEGARHAVLDQMTYIPRALRNVLSPPVLAVLNKGTTYGKRPKFSRGSSKKPH